MNDIESLRQEAESLKNQIRVCNKRLSRFKSLTFFY
jgi:hypothetical protein